MAEPEDKRMALPNLLQFILDWFYFWKILYRTAAATKPTKP